MLEEKTKHEQYKGHDIRSSPFEVKGKEKEGWQVHIDITLPPTHGTTSMREHVDEKVYITLNDAHTAGFEWGRQIIDEEIQDQHSPISSK